MLLRALRGVMARSRGFDLVLSTFRFLAGGAFFVVVVAVPFFVLAGAGRFFEGAGSVSVDGTGTEESRRGECSDFIVVNGFRLEMVSSDLESE